MSRREPIFGANAKAFFIQALVAIIVFWLANRYLRPWLEQVVPPITRAIFGWFE